MLSNPITFTDISVSSLSNLSIACKLIGNSIPLKLTDSACFLKCFVIRSVFFQLDSNLLRYTIWKHWLSVFFMLMSAFLLAINFGRGTKNFSFNDAYPTVWISCDTMEWSVHPLPFIWNFARSLRTCSVTFHSCLLIQEQFHFLIWIDVLPRGFGQSWDLFFLSLISKFFSLWFAFGFLRVPFVSQQSKRILGHMDSGSKSILGHIGSSVNWFVKTLKEDCFTFFNFNTLSSISSMSCVFLSFAAFLIPSFFAFTMRFRFLNWSKYCGFESKFLIVISWVLKCHWNPEVVPRLLIVWEFSLSREILLYVLHRQALSAFATLYLSFIIG